MNSKVVAGDCYSIGTVTAVDGLSLFYRKWDSATGAVASVVIVHGLGEHSGRYVHVGKYFAEAGFRTIAFDLRGHGRSSGETRLRETLRGTGIRRRLCRQTFQWRACLRFWPQFWRAVGALDRAAFPTHGGGINCEFSLVSARLCAASLAVVCCAKNEPTHSRSSLFDWHPFGKIVPRSELISTRSRISICCTSFRPSGFIWRRQMRRWKLGAHP